MAKVSTLAVALVCCVMLTQVNAFHPAFFLLGDNMMGNNGMNFFSMMCFTNPAYCQNPAMMMPMLAQNDNMRNMMMMSQLARGGKPNLLMFSGNDHMSALGTSLMMQQSRRQPSQPASQQQQSSNSQQSQQSGGAASSQGPTPTQ